MYRYIRVKTTVCQAVKRVDRSLEMRRRYGGPCGLPLQWTTSAMKSCKLYTKHILVEIIGPEGNDSKDLVLAESDRWPAQDMICISILSCPMYIREHLRQRWHTYHDAQCSPDMQRRKQNRKATKGNAQYEVGSSISKEGKTVVGSNKERKTRLESSLHNNCKKDEFTQG